MYLSRQKNGNFRLKDRFISMLIVFSIMLSTIAIAGPFNIAFATNGGETEASDSGVIGFDDGDINYDSKLRDNGDGTYTLSLDVWSDVAKSDKNTRRDISENGFFVVQFDGKYLVELWGGSGASGQTTKYNKGGKGGAGGHTYGVIDLKKGDILCYNLGGKGDTTLVTDAGGGANGGAAHGEKGNYRVGGGGGYSSVYLFKNGTEADNFIKNYTDGNGTLTRKVISESDRLSKYVMIAAGGGGGGAGDGFILGYKPSGTADGGAGGSIGNAVTSFNGGKVFNGENGKSSGKKLKYIGYGATTQPGETNGTWLGWWDGANANNWEGTVSGAKVGGGTGGAGNFRGGGGGAGFCGGSGGIMASAMVAGNIGGGGGGSSYVSDLFDYSSVSDEVKNKVNPNDGTTGSGNVNISYLGNKNDNLSNTETDWLKNLVFTANASKYFDVTASSATANVTVDGSKITLKNANLNEENGKFNLTVKFTPKAGFKGGNDVNLFEDTAKEFTISDNAGKTSSINLSDKVSYANIPLNGFEASGNDDIGISAGESVERSALFNDSYADARNNPDYTYDFIKTVSEYTVKEFDTGVEITDTSISPSVSTAYIVGFTVTPKTINPSKAVVGEAVKTTEYTAGAFIDVFSEMVINGVTYNIYKKITFDKGTGKYTLSVTLKSSERPEDKDIPDGPKVNDAALSFTQDLPTSFTNQTFTSNDTFTAPVSGYYIIQAWGGNGGNGGSVAITNKGGKKREAIGGIGGTGGYVSTVVYLKKNETLTLENGAKGLNGESYDIEREGNTEYNITCDGGKAGIPTIIKFNNNIMAQASGGAGGGGGACHYQYKALFNEDKDAIFKHGTAGVSVTETTNIFNDIGSSADGSKGTASSSGVTGGIGGQTAAKNYISSELTTSTYPVAVQTVYDSLSSSNPNFTSGAAKITFVDTRKTEAEVKDDLTNRLSGIMLDTYSFTKYFKNIVVTTPTADDFTNVIEINGPVDNGDGTETTTAKLGGDGVTWTFTFEPKDGFLGGNYVPALESLTLKQGESGAITVPENITTDFVNVEITNPITAAVNEANVKDGKYRVKYGTNVSFADLFTVTGTWPTDADNTAFVNQIDETDIDRTSGFNATETKKFTYTYGITPTNAASKAKVAALQKEQSQTLTASVEVYSDVDVSGLKHMTYDGPTEVTYGDKLVATVKTNSGYEAPTTFTVKSGTTTLTEGNDYTYDKATGELVVNAESIKGTVYIIAEAGVKTYKIHFEATDQHGLPIVISADKATQSFEAGAPIPAGVEPFDASTMPAKTGYKFVWDWNTDDGQPLKEMTAHDYYVYGSYEPLFYTVKINYVDTSNRPIASATQYVNENAYYTLKETVASPAIPGYKLVDPAQASVSYEVNDATIGTHNENEVILEINVKYALTEDNVTVRHIYENTGEVFAVEYAKVNVGDSYTAKAKTDVSGYTGTDKTITASANKEENVVDILYTPGTYKIDFISEGKKIGTINATYNDVYPDFPEIENPQTEDKVFAGWYTAEIGGVKIDENDVFTGTSDTTYYAHWNIAPKFTVTVNPSDWTKNSVTFEFTGTNEKFTYTSDNVTYQYSTDGGNTWFNVPGTEFGKFTVDTEGETEYKFKAVAKNLDEFVNEGTYTARIDKSAPTAKMKLSEPDTLWFKITEKIDDLFGTHFTKEKVQMEILDAEDTLSGLADTSSVMYFVSDTKVSASDIANGTYAWKEYKAPVVINATGDDINEGKYFVYAKVTDKVGNVLYLGTDGLVVDTTAPAVGGKSNFDGEKWINSATAVDAAVISGAATDKTENGSGLNYLEYSLDGGNTWTRYPDSGSSVKYELPYSFTNDLFAEGKGQTVQLRAYDLVGNASAVTTLIVNKDTVNPAITVSAPTGADSAWVTAENPEITVSDATSGVKSVQYKEASETTWHSATVVDAAAGKYTAEITSNGTYTFKVTDVAGNETTETVTYSFVDSVSPTFDISATSKSKAYDFENAPWINDDVTFIINPTSANTGTVTYKYREVGSAAYTTVTETTDGKPSFKVDKQGEKLGYEIIAVSASGKESTPTTVKTSIDKVVPTGSVQLNDRTATTTLVKIADPLDLFFKDPVKVQMTYADGLSGVASASYYLSHSAMTEEQLSAMTDGWTTYSALFSVEENDDYIVYARIIDKAGNVAFLSSDGFIFDKVAPKIDVDLTSAKDKVNGWSVDAEIEFPVTITDDQSPKGISGVDTTAGKITYAYDNNAPEGYKGVEKTATTVTDPSGAVKFTIPNGDIPAGRYTITITAYDRAGNIATADIEVMRAKTSLTVVAQPTDISVEYGTASAKFSVDIATVAEGLTYKWQCKRPGDTAWTDVGENSPQLVVSNPTVVANNGEKYRVIVTSGAEISTTSDEVTLSVQKAKLTVSPKSHEKNYGQADAELDYTVTGYKFADAGMVTFDGGFEREPGEDAGTYVIKNKDLRLANDSAADNVNGNYYIDIQPATSSYVINPYDPADTNAYLDGTMGNNGWYTSEVKIKAPDGFLISRTNSADDSAWSEELTVADDGIHNNVKYYLRNNDPTDTEFYKSITGEKLVSFKIDKTAPTVTVKYDDGNFWTDLLHTITFGLFSKGHEVEVTANDAMSGVASVKYFKIDSEEALTTAEAVEAAATENGGWSDVNSGKVPVNPDEKTVIYVCVTDNVGNKVYASSQGMIAEDDAPEITFAAKDVAGDNVTATYETVKCLTKNNDRIHVTVNEKDTVISGLASVTYKINNKAEKAYDGFTVGAALTKFEFAATEFEQGENTVTVTSVDRSGNSSTATYKFWVDTKLPTVEMTADTTTIETEKTIELTPDFGVTGGKVYVSKDDGATWTEVTKDADGKYIVTVTDADLGADGSVTYTAKVVNGAGIENISPDTITFKDVIDNTSPDLSVTGVPTGWTNENVTVTVDNNNPNFGTTRYYYTTDADPSDKTKWVEIDPATGFTVDADTNTEYTIIAVAENGLTDTEKVAVKVDKSAPTGEISVDTNLWKEFLSDITFGIYKNDTVTVKITNDSSISGNKSVKYIKTSDVITDKAALEARTDWTDYNGQFTIPAVDAEKFVIYARIEDNAGNVTFLSSNGHVFDTSKPDIAVSSNIDGVNDSPSYGDRIVTVTDANLDTVTVTDKDGNTVAMVTFNADGTADVTYPDPTTKVKVVEPVTADPNGKDIVKIVLPNDDNEYTVSATDKAGNSTTPVKVVEKSIDTFIDEIESELPKNPETGKPDTSLATDEKLGELIDRIDKLLDKETTDGNEPSNLDPDEIQKLKDERDKLLDQIKDNAKSELEKEADKAKDEINNKGNLSDEEKKTLTDEIDKALDDAKKDIDNSTTHDEIKDIVDNTKDKFDDTKDDATARDFVNKYASDNDADNPYNKTDSNPVTKDNAAQIIGGSDTYDNHKNSVKDKINDLINQGKTDGTTYPDYPSMKFDAEKALKDAKDAAIKELEEAAKAAEDEIKGKENLSDNEKKELVDKVKDDLDKAKDDINNAGSNEDIKDIVDNTKDKFNDTKDDATARDFVNKYASDNDADNPYNKTDNKVDKTNADKVISGADTYDGHTDSVKDKINDLINKGKTDGTTYPDYPSMKLDAEKALKDAKDAAKDDLDKAAEDAKKEIDSKDDLTDKEKEDLKNEIDKALDDAKKDIDNATTDDQIKDIVDETKKDFDLTVDKADAIDQIEKKEKETEAAIDALPNLSDEEKKNLKDEARAEADSAIADVNKVDGTVVDGKTPAEQLDKIVDDAKKTLDDTKDDATARDFVNKYASDNDADNPYNKTDNKVDKTNADKVISGSDIYNGHTDSVKDKINDLINQGKSDGTTYPDYPSMKLDADKALQDAKDAAKDELDKAAEDAKKEIDSKENLTDEEKDKLKEEIDNERDKGKADIDNAGSDKEIDKAVEDTKKEFEDTKDDATARDFVNKYASDNNADDPYDKGNNPITDENIDKILSGSDTYDKMTDSVKDKVNGLISNQKADGSETYDSYPDMKKDAEKKAQELADKFIEDYLLPNGKTYPENSKDVYGTATKNNADQIISGKDAWDKLPKAAQDIVNAAIDAVKGTTHTYPELLNEAKFIVGDKDVEFVNVDKDVSIKASGLENLFDNPSVYTNKDKETVAKGGHVRIENIVQKQIKSQLSSSEQSSSDKFLIKYGLKAGLYLEITLVKYVYEYNAETGKYVLAYTENITDTAPDKIKYVLDIPQELLGKDEYYVIRIHNGVEEIIATAPKGSTQITFETDKFSTYILAYKEPEEKTAKTLDENRFGNIGAAFALTAVMYVATKRRRKDDESEMY